MTPVELRGIAEIAGQFGLDVSGAAPLGEGRVNSHWRLTTPSGDFVLRRYRPERSTESVAWEHALLSHAASRGWPVADARPASNGATSVTWEGALFALFPLLAGTPREAASAAQHHLNGRLLARLHRDLEGFDRGQRPNFGRAWELDVFVQAAGEESFNGLLARFTAEHPEPGRVVRGEKYRNLRELARLGYGEVPDVPIHGDFRAEHLLYNEGALSGLLDFDHARRDAHMFDIASAIGLGCRQDGIEGDAIDVAAARAFLEGYAEGRPITESEALLLVALLRAHLLWGVMFRLLQWREGNPRAVASIQRSVTHRFPALIQRSAALETAALGVANA